MNRIVISLAAAAALAVGGTALAEQQPAPSGYLGDAAPDSYKILPPAPTPGTIRYQADRSAFLATRSLKDSPRWSLAAADADEAAIVKDMSCAIGMELTPQAAPKLTNVTLPLSSRASPAIVTSFKPIVPMMVNSGINSAGTNSQLPSCLAFVARASSLTLS